MTRLYASCTLGLEEVLAGELAGLGAGQIETGRGGVHFDGDRRVGYAANLWLRSAIRVQRQIAVGEVRKERELYGLVHGQEWERFLTPDGTLAVDASVRDSFLTHSQYAAQLVKDAIVDRFRAKQGRRPNVDLREPDLPVRLHLNRNRATLYVDLSGRSLHKRGYRPVQVKSPLNEATAAGLLLATGWDRRSPLLDPMCGSGTFAIEAAWLAGDRAPGLGRPFAFERWPDLDQETWAEVFDDAEARAARGLAAIPPILAADRHSGAIAIAREAARSAGVAEHVTFLRSPIADLRPDPIPALVVTNPPYGERLGEGADLEASWRELGEFLRRVPGSIAWILSGSSELTRFLRLRTTRRMPVHNGPIECRFLRYEIDANRMSEPITE